MITKFDTYKRLNESPEYIFIRSPEELRQQHVLSPMLKKQKTPVSKYHLPKFDIPLNVRQSMYAESMNEGFLGFGTNYIKKLKKQHKELMKTKEKLDKMIEKYEKISFDMMTKEQQDKFLKRKEEIEKLLREIDPYNEENWDFKNDIEDDDLEEEGDMEEDNKKRQYIKRLGILKKTRDYIRKNYEHLDKILKFME